MSGKGGLRPPFRNSPHLVRDVGGAFGAISGIGSSHARAEPLLAAARGLYSLAAPARAGDGSAGAAASAAVCSCLTPSSSP
jgi:hypothetical protein